MRKVIGKQSLVKAIALSLAAIMTVAQPLTAFAESGDDYEDDYDYEDILDAYSSGITDEASAVIGDIAGAFAISSEDGNKAVSDIIAEAVTEFKEGEVGTNEEGEDRAAIVEEAIRDLTEEIVGSAIGVNYLDNQLKEIETTNTEETLQAIYTVGTVNEAVEVADKAVDSMDEAIKQATKLREVIDNPGTTVEEAKAAANAIDELASSAAKELEEAVAVFDKAKAEYDEAKVQLLALAEQYDKAVEQASSTAAVIRDELAVAQQRADELKEAVEDAKEGVEETTKGAVAIMEKQEEVKEQFSWPKEDELFCAIVENYYMPVVENAAVISIKRVDGYDFSEANYFIVTYTDIDGKETTKYLNYKIEEDDGKMVVFEKEFKEIVSDILIKNHVTPRVDVEQNYNYRTGNYMLESTDKAFNEHLKDAIDLIEKYDRLASEADAVESVIAESEEFADNLAEAIEDLKNQDNKIVSAAQAFGVENLAEYFGIELEDEDEEEFFNSLTLEEAIVYLDKKLEIAKKNIEKAQGDLEVIKGMIKDVEEEIDKSPIPPTGDVDDTTLPVVLPVVDPVVPVVVDPAVPVVVPRAAPVVVAQVAPIVATTTQVVVPVLNEDEATATIEDNQVPLAGEIVDEPEATVTIEDEEVPLAGSIPVDKTARNWWWLLLIVVAAVGYYTYRRYKNRQAA